MPPRRLKATKELGIRIQPTPPADVRIVGMSDGSFDTEESTGASQRGSLVGMAPKNLYRNELSASGSMCWQSHKIRRVVGSTMGAESCPFSESLAECEWMLMLWRETIYSDDDARTGLRRGKSLESELDVAVMRSDSAISIDPSVVSMTDGDHRRF